MMAVIRPAEFSILKFIAFVIILTRINQAAATVYAYVNFNETETFDDMEASFGPNIDIGGIAGLLVRAEPIDGCKTIKPSPFQPCNPQNITIASFTLIARGGCDFGVKVLNAQAAGFCGAIVYNLGSDQLVRMSTAVTNEIYIPSIFIGETAATILNKTFLYNEKGQPSIEISESSFNPLDYYLVPFLVVIAICFVSLLCFLLVKCFRDRRRVRRGRLSLQRLKKLPVKKFDKGDEYDVCAICLEDYEEGDSLRILPCDHAYHCKCVDPWLTSSKRVCPLCKRRVLSDDESSTSSDNADDSSDDERTPLVRSSTASSPNSPRYATGYGSSNPFTGQSSHHRPRNSSTSSTETTSTDMSESNHPILKRTTVDVSSSGANSSRVYQSLAFTEAQEQKQFDIASTTDANSYMEPDDYLSSAEAVMTGPRISESSIAVLSDIETYGTTPEQHSYSSQDFHSLDESVTVGRTPTNEDIQYDLPTEESDHDDIIVIAQGSTTLMHEDHSEV